MAFTLAHPAAIVPLRKLPGMALLPLIIGSVMPDLIPLLPFGWEQYLPNSHSPMGSLLVDLPAGYVLLLMIYWLRKVLVQPLWQPHRAIAMHTINDYFAMPRCWLIALPSLLAGIWTHLVWDRFTHETRWTSHHLSLLYEPLFPDAAHQMPLYHFLQYFTSALGLLYLAWQYWRTVHNTRIEARHNAQTEIPAGYNSKPLALVILLLSALLLGALRLWHGDVQHESVYMRLSVVLKTAIGCFGLMYLATGLLMRRNRQTSS